MDLKLVVDASGLTDLGRVEPGDSVSVDGVCLTVTVIQGTELHFDVSHETLERTTIGSRSLQDGVNLELSLQPQSRLSRKRGTAKFARQTSSTQPCTG